MLLARSGREPLAVSSTVEAPVWLQPRCFGPGHRLDAVPSHGRAVVSGVAVAVLSLASAAAAAGSGWSIQHIPNPAGASDNQLNGVSCASASACTAAGDHWTGTTYVTLAERGNGTKWSIQHPANPTGSPNSELLGVSCASATACTAAGQYSNGTTTLALGER